VRGLGGHSLGPTVPFWALHLAEESVVAVRVQRAPEDRLEVLDWWTAPVPAGGDPAAAALKAIRARGHRGHAYHLVLAGRGAACRSCRISPEDSDLSPGELERELLDFTPFEPDEALVRARRLGGPGVLDYRVVSERRGEVGRIEKAFEDAGHASLGIALAPAALLAGVESLRLGPARGFALDVQGTWSMLAAFDGPLSARYPIPFGLADLARRLEAAGGPGRDAALDAAPGSPEARALGAALEPFLLDLRRALEFHRSAVRPTGDESLLLLGEAGARPGLRAALAAASPVPAAPPSLPAEGPIRAGPRVDPSALASALPRLLVPLGAAASAAGLASRDLDFRSLPDALPVPREASLFPAAAGILAASAAAAWLLASDARGTLERAAAVLASLPPPAAAGAIPAEQALARADEAEALGEAARVRAALGRALSNVVSVFPRAGETPAIPFGAERIEVRSEGGNYRTVVVLRTAGAPAREGAAETARLSALAEPLAAAGWRVVETRAGTITVERLELRRERSPR